MIEYVIWLDRWLIICFYCFWWNEKVEYCVKIYLFFECFRKFVVGGKLVMVMRLYIMLKILSLKVIINLYCENV